MFDFSLQNAMTNPGFETPSLLRKWGSFQNEMDSLFENLLAQHGEVSKFTATSFWMRAISKEATLHSICLHNITDPLAKALFDDVQFREGDGNQFVPDIVAVKTGANFKRELPIEVKTSKNCPSDVFDKFNSGSKKGKAVISQIYSYMCSRRIKYGILIRYDRTFFFRVIIERSLTVLEVSNPVLLKDLRRNLCCFLHIRDLWEVWEVKLERPIVVPEVESDDNSKHEGGREGRGRGRGRGEGKKGRGGGRQRGRGGQRGHNNGQIGEHVINLSYELIGYGGCGTVFRGTFDDQPVAIKLIDIRSHSNAITEALQEVAVYKHLKDLQGKYIPFLYWHGYLFDGAYYALVMTLCADAGCCTDEEMADVLSILRARGAIQTDARPENFVRSSIPQGKLMAIDFGRTKIEYQVLK
jgi:hypothetical protein